MRSGTCCGSTGCRKPQTVLGPFVPICEVELGQPYIPINGVPWDEQGIGKSESSPSQRGKHRPLQSPTVDNETARTCCLVAGDPVARETIRTTATRLGATTSPPDRANNAVASSDGRRGLAWPPHKPRAESARSSGGIITVDFRNLR